MTAWALYSEIDPFAAAWLTKLIGAGHIMPGVVDTRSLEDLTPDECNEFRQVHLCAGIGVWSYALRLAGWEDNRACWTASFPCQPFSAAGKGAAFADERHIWPAGHWLIDQCRPAKIFGEQVASKDGLAWLDVVSSDLEASGYAVGTADLCAAGVGGPHIRQRSYWVADAINNGQRQYGNGVGETTRASESELPERTQRFRANPADGGFTNRLGDDDDARLERYDGHGDYGNQSGWLDAQSVGSGRAASEPVRLEHDPSDGRQQRRTEPSGRGSLSGCGVGGVGDAAMRGRQYESSDQPESVQRKQASDTGRGAELSGRSARSNDASASGPTDGYWRNADWLYCRDGKWRPVEPGTFPLAHGATHRVGRLRGYGNAIVAPVAQAFIEAVMACKP